MRKPDTCVDGGWDIDIFKLWWPLTTQRNGHKFKKLLFCSYGDVGVQRKKMANRSNFRQENGKSHVCKWFASSRFLQGRKNSIELDRTRLSCPRGYPVSVVQAGYHRAQLIDRQAALQTAEKENTDRIPFTLTFHPHNHAVKSIILKNFKLLQNDSETGTIFSQPPLISFKRDKNIGNFLVRSSFPTYDQPMTNLELLNALAHNAKLVLSFIT